MSFDSYKVNNNDQKDQKIEALQEMGINFTVRRTITKKKKEIPKKQTITPPSPPSNLIKNNDLTVTDQQSKYFAVKSVLVQLDDVPTSTSQVSYTYPALYQTQNPHAIKFHFCNPVSMTNRCRDKDLSLVNFVKFDYEDNYQIENKKVKKEIKGFKIIDLV